MVRRAPAIRPRFLAAALLLAVPLAGCVQTGTGLHAEIRSNPRSLIDSYLIARGMALSYGHSGRAGPAEITQLIQYDRAALIAVATATLEPGDGKTAQAQQAVRAMVRYTGDQDLRPLPAADALAN